ncbi:MAG: excinuclease ABC subunit UvrB [Candidatus Sumerlaeia bacterium]|nr:excinuclease ABC subunit UvrB [Candidatus Sumerlaeia bacterium]
MSSASHSPQEIEKGAAFAEGAERPRTFFPEAGEEYRHEPFRVVSPFEPAGDQPRAIERLVEGLARGVPAMTLLGATGTGKTFTIAKVVEVLNRTTLVLAPNKTLAAQLYREFKEFLPDNAVEYFVSYYDYYQPEAYIPSSDTYIEKDSSINDELDKLRLSATKSLIERRDTLVVASVSCIYGIGSPSEFHALVVLVREGERISRDALLRRLVEIQYRRDDMDFYRGSFRVRGDVVDVFPAYEEERALRIEFFGDEIEALSEIDPMTGARLQRIRRAALYPTTVYATRKDTLQRALVDIQEELATRLRFLEENNRLVEYQRLKQRTDYDMEMLRETGTCPGIENYSRHLAGRGEGEPPYTLLDYFPDDFLLVVDESHIAVPQLRAMFAGDRSRKQTLVEYGFRLPSALDNRPLRFEEFERRVHQAVFVSATPSAYELGRSEGVVVEQLIRPTGLVDPTIHVRPVADQVQDLIAEAKLRAARNQRTLVTTLTKRFAEDLTEYLSEAGLKARYMHSDVKVLERVEIIQDLRSGKIDVLVGINLLREGLDLPEVSLVAILDADKEGFLRSTVSLIQTVGRAARNVDGTVILYADRMTDSMRAAIEETDRRRALQAEHNERHGITPQSIQKNLTRIIETAYEPATPSVEWLAAEQPGEYLGRAELERRIEELKADMRSAARVLDFELAAVLRDRMVALQRKLKDL